MGHEIRHALRVENYYTSSVKEQNTFMNNTNSYDQNRKQRRISKQNENVMLGIDNLEVEDEKNEESSKEKDINDNGEHMATGATGVTGATGSKSDSTGAATRTSTGASGASGASSATGVSLDSIVDSDASEKEMNAVESLLNQFSNSATGANEATDTNTSLNQSTEELKNKENDFTNVASSLVQNITNNKMNTVEVLPTFRKSTVRVQESKVRLPTLTTAMRNSHVVTYTITGDMIPNQYQQKEQKNEKKEKQNIVEQIESLQLSCTFDQNTFECTTFPTLKEASAAYNQIYNIITTNRQGDEPPTMIIHPIVKEKQHEKEQKEQKEEEEEEEKDN